MHTPTNCATAGPVVANCTRNPHSAPGLPTRSDFDAPCTPGGLRTRPPPKAPPTGSSMPCRSRQNHPSSHPRHDLAPPARPSTIAGAAGPDHAATRRDPAPPAPAPALPTAPDAPDPACTRRQTAPRPDQLSPTAPGTPTLRPGSQRGPTLTRPARLAAPGPARRRGLHRPDPECHAVLAWITRARTPGHDLAPPARPSTIAGAAGPDHAATRRDPAPPLPAPALPTAPDAPDPACTRRQTAPRPDQLAPTAPGTPTLRPGSRRGPTLTRPARSCASGHAPHPPPRGPPHPTAAEPPGPSRSSLP